jgi:molybdate/tungstate transport system substrate-binding protein
MQTKIFVIITLTLLLITASLTGCVDDDNIKELIELKVFHAGSLSGPFEEIETYFENEHKYIDVQREAAGSADTIRKVTDIGKVADVVGSADHTLIESMMIDNEPQYANYYIQFARNQLVIAYTDHSAYKNDINKTNWYEIFQKSDVNFGFSNPNADPCGYRALMLIQLSELHYSQPTLFEDLVVSHTDIDISETNGNYTISAPENLNPDDTVMIRPKETDLMAQLESGDLDYLLIYRSVAYQHRDSGVEFIELPAQIDLSLVDYAETYGKVNLVTYSDLPGESKTITAKPIVYGITIPTNAEHFNEAVEFVKVVVGEKGQQVLTDLGQPPIVPARTNDISQIPEELKSLVVEI